MLNSYIWYNVRSHYECQYVTSLTWAHCVSSDDSASAASSMEVTDRIASLEQRVQMQEDEIQLLKSALADVVRRLNVSEEQQAMGSRRGPTKGNRHNHVFFQTFLLGRQATGSTGIWRCAFSPFPPCSLSFLMTPPSNRTYFPLLTSCRSPLPLPFCPLFSWTVLCCWTCCASCV